MVWIDFPILAIMLLATYAGWTRGFIGELFDVLILTLGNFITIALYLHLGDFLISLFGKKLGCTYSVSYILVFTITGIIIFSIGYKLERRVKDGFHKPLYQGLGGLMGFVKGWLLLFIGFYLFAFTPMSGGTVKLLKTSRMVTTIQAAEPAIESMALIFTPARIENQVIDHLKKSVFANGK